MMVPISNENLLSPRALNRGETGGGEWKFRYPRTTNHSNNSYLLLESSPDNARYLTASAMHDAIKVVADTLMKSEAVAIYVSKINLTYSI